MNVVNCKPPLQVFGTLNNYGSYHFVAGIDTEQHTVLPKHIM